MDVTLVFIHGWSVTNLNTYGELPLRLPAEGERNDFSFDIREIFLGRYISFHDEVKMPDISNAFERSVREQLADLIANGRRFVCITHSTGGPVARDWWNRFYKSTNTICPMSHLVMLAPANFGSALAKLGKQRIGRLKSWFSGVEPGQGILDWLELGSSEAWALNLDWIENGDGSIGPTGIFPFVLTGQSIDRKFYDHLNAYTGEIGSDGVVRVAAANLDARYISLTQTLDKPGDLQIETFKTSPATPLRILEHKSHSGTDMGIMASVKKDTNDIESATTVRAILDCINVKSIEEYKTIHDVFAAQSKAVQEKEKIEVERGTFLADRYFIHDRYSMIIFRVRDHEGNAVRDYDLILTAGDLNDPNHLPEGFFADRQQNGRANETLTYFFNYDLMIGTAAVMDSKGKELRAATPGITKLGLQINPRPGGGFVRYAPCSIVANTALFEQAIQPNSTTLMEITLRRIVDREVFRLEKHTGDDIAFDFKKVTPSLA